MEQTTGTKNYNGWTNYETWLAGLYFDGNYTGEETYSEVRRMARDRLIFDFISTHRTPSYPAEDFIYYHDPVEILAFCFELTPRVSLKHDYLPIPQREGMIALSHSES